MPRQQGLQKRALTCKACKDSKVRCDKDPGSEKCHRCLRKGQACTSEPSKREYRPETLAKRSASSRIPDQDVPIGTSTSSPAFWPNPNKATLFTDGGYPSLSNPIKLLAQASEGIEQETIFPNLAVTNTSDVAKAVETSDVARWRSSFTAGMYAPRYETRSEFDPINCGILSTSRAGALFHTYMDQHNDANVILDPEYHTFDYLRNHNFLSTVLYLVMARQECFDGADEVGDGLSDHMNQTILPFIHSNGCRSVEIVIGMLLLAKFHSSTRILANTHYQSWTFLGHAIRMGTELDINSRIVSKVMPSGDERAIRQYRAQERAWLNVYLTSRNFCLQTGRRNFLSYEGVVEDAEDWHLAPFAFKHDVTLIALINLHRIFLVHRFLFNRLASDSQANDSDRVINAGLKERDLEYYLHRVDDSLRFWYDRFKDIDSTPARSSQLRLCLNHFKIMLYSMTLQNTTGNLQIVEPALLLLYETTVTHLGEITDSNSISQLESGRGQGHSGQGQGWFFSSFISRSYVAVMALKLTTLGQELTWINVDYLFTLVKDTADMFTRDKKGSRKGKKSASEALGEYIYWLLRRYQAQWMVAKEGKRAQESRHQQNGSTVSNTDAVHTLDATPAFAHPISSRTDANQATLPLDGTAELWSDHVDFTEDNDFFTWAQTFLHEQ